MKNLPRRLCMFLAVATMLVCTIGASQAADKATLRLSWLIQSNFAPFFLGVDKGFYKEEGIDLTINEGKGSGLAAKLVAQKKDDFGIASIDVVINGIERGLPIQVTWCHYQINPMGVFYLKERGFAGPKDLVGKKVAGSANSSMTLLLKPLLRLNGVDPSKVEIFNTNPPFDPLLLAKKVDAMVGYYVDGVPRLEEKGVNIGVIKYADHGLNTLSNGLIAHNDTVQKNKDLIRRMVRATSKSWLYAKDHIEEAVDSVLPRMAKGKRATQIEILKNVVTLFHTKNTEGKPFGWMSEKDWQQTVDLLTQAGLLKKASKVSRYYTNEFIPQM